MAGRVLAVCGMPFEAALARGPGVVAVCGPGPARAAREPADLAPDDAGRWDGIVSFGCAAGLDPALEAGACVVATGVLTPDGVIPTDARWTRALLACLPGARAGLLAGVDVPLATSAAKAALWRATGAAAADMESHAAAGAARRFGLPFAACRVVLDPAWRGVPPCALAGLRADGAVAPGAVLRDLVGDPRQFSLLCALARDAWAARRMLVRVRARLAALPGATFGLRAE